MKKDKCTAVILAGGSGSRMKSSVPKQYMNVAGKPLIWYALNAVQKSGVIDECILVTGADDIDTVTENIVNRYAFTKVSTVVAGGSERCFSVRNALIALREKEQKNPTDSSKYIFIHDGARPFLTEEILQRMYEAVVEHRAVVAAVPSKDTIKIADEYGFVSSTPDRRKVWSIQTPQVFEKNLILEAYLQLTKDKYDKLVQGGVAVTDDAGVVELFGNTGIKLVMGDYENIKITTPEDIALAESLIGL